MLVVIGRGSDILSFIFEGEQGWKKEYKFLENVSVYGDYEVIKILNIYDQIEFYWSGDGGGFILSFGL